MQKKAVKMTASLFLTVLLTITTVFAQELIPVGQTVGIKLSTDGAVIVKLSSVQTESGEKTPAKDAGLQEGDVIISANGKNVLSNEDLRQTIFQSNGEAIRIAYRRPEQEHTCTVAPVRSMDGKYRIGVMIRDSMAGIGTITYIDPQTGDYGSLGHGICDSETGQLIPMKEGAITESSVAGVQKGEVGAPGELEGEFQFSSDIGTIEKNTDSGIFGTVTQGSFYQGKQTVPTAEFSEVTTGPVEILANVEGSRVEAYTAEILKIASADKSGRNFMIRITDPKLLEKTGGIVQGMSGSPILQNGKLVGAVTHVLVNDPQRGYGIFIDEMLETAKS